MKEKTKKFKKLFGFTRLVKPFAQIWTRAMTWQSSCTRNLRKPSFANAHSYGFTLAEVLITLSILGVVAAITVPSLIQRQHEREIVTKVKKVYSALTTAYDIVQAEYGTDPSSWIAETGDRAIIIKRIADRLNVDKRCEKADKTCASQDSVYVSLDGTEFPHKNLNYSEYRVKLKDGMIITFSVNSTDCSASYGSIKELKTVCSEFMVDVNGDKKPNKIGVDLFHFLLTNKSIYPSGVKGMIGEYGFDEGCNNSVTGWTHGTGCTAWAIYKGNMDYLRKNVSW